MRRYRPPLPRPEPEKPTTATYMVVGPHSVFGHNRGETAALTLSKDQEKHLVEAGHIVRLDGAAVEAAQEKVEAPAVEAIDTEESD